MLAWFDPHAESSRLFASGSRCPNEIARMVLVFSMVSAFLNLEDLLFRDGSPGFLHFTPVWQIECVTRILQVEGQAHRFTTYHVGALPVTAGVLSGIGTRYDNRHTRLTHLIY